MSVTVDQLLQFRRGRVISPLVVRQISQWSDFTQARAHEALAGVYQRLCETLAKRDAPIFQAEREVEDDEFLIKYCVRDGAICFLSIERVFQREGGSGPSGRNASGSGGGPRTFSPSARRGGNDPQSLTELLSIAGLPLLLAEEIGSLRLFEGIWNEAWTSPAIFPVHASMPFVIINVGSALSIYTSLELTPAADGPLLFKPCNFSYGKLPSVRPVNYIWTDRLLHHTDGNSISNVCTKSDLANEVHHIVDRLLFGTQFAGIFSSVFDRQGDCRVTRSSDSTGNVHAAVRKFRWAGIKDDFRVFSGDTLGRVDEAARIRRFASAAPGLRIDGALGGDDGTARAGRLLGSCRAQAAGDIVFGIGRSGCGGEADSGRVHRRDAWPGGAAPAEAIVGGGHAPRPSSSW